MQSYHGRKSTGARGFDYNSWVEVCGQRVANLLLNKNLTNQGAFESLFYCMCKSVTVVALIWFWIYYDLHIENIEVIDMAHVVILERTESFTITVEDAESESHAIEVAKEVIAEDNDSGAQWSDSLEFTFENSWED